MSDRFSAQIWIGGQISRTARLLPDDPDDDTTILQGLIGALHDDGASHEFGDVVILEDCCDSPELYFYLDDSDFLNLKCDQAVNGEFPETEEFCIQNGIAFNRWSDHYGEYGAENVHFRPGMDAPLTTYADSAGKEIVCGDTVRQAIEKLDEFNKVVGACTALSPKLSADDWLNFIAGLRLLHDACPTLPRKLESFEVIA